MLKSKLITLTYIILLAALGVFIFLYLQEKSERLDAESRFAEEKKLALRNERELNQDKLDSLTVLLQFTAEALREEELNIKYRPYEKLLYTDRTVDAALDTIAVYKFDSRTKTKSN